MLQIHGNLGKLCAAQGLVGKINLQMLDGERGEHLLDLYMDEVDRRNDAEAAAKAAKAAEAAEAAAAEAAAAEAAEEAVASGVAGGGNGSGTNGVGGAAAAVAPPRPSLCAVVVAGQLQPRATPPPPSGTNSAAPAEGSAFFPGAAEAEKSLL